MVTSSAQYGPFKPSNDTGLVGGAIGGTIVTSTRATSPTFSKTNPPFSTSVAGKVPKTVDSASRGDDGKIVRGFIRRENDTDKADPTSGYRLNFMYNPETIQRQFIAYLDQGALDPFNSINGSGNLAAPPGILDFSFELMFDRQLEVFRDDNHPGTKVDYDYFDLVVRGVVPGVSAIPDNGVMMVNPRNITVVFGPDLTVTGKPYNASVSFDKFSHKMTPTRIRVLMQMKVLTVGPRPLAYTYQTATAQAEFAATVPYDNTITASITNTVDATAANATGSAFIDALRLDWSGGTSSSTGGGIDTSIANAGSSLAVAAGVVDVSGKGAAAAAGWIREAMRLTGVPEYWYSGLMTIAKRESSYNPNVANINDSNARKGTPSIGLMQVIQPTFDTYKLPGHNDIHNPVDNAIASIRYIQKTYGDISKVQQADPNRPPKGY
jgi:hypothetical protein